MSISLVPLPMTAAVEQAKVDVNAVVHHDLGTFSFNPEEGRYHDRERLRLERDPRGLR